MVVRSIGNSLLVILPELVGKKITNWFDLVRPLIAFKFQTVQISADPAGENSNTFMSRVYVFISRPDRF